MKSEDEIDSVMFSYTAESNQLEEENRMLKDAIDRLNNELNKFKHPPLMICEVCEVLEDKVLIRIPNGNQFLVNISKDCEKLEAGDSVLVEQKNLTIIRKHTSVKKFDVEKFVIIDKPTIEWEKVGGLKDQVQEIIEVVELPLKKPGLFKKIGIQPHKGVLLHGPPGTGKTLLAKAVAASTKSTFIEIVGSELVQKFIGEGAKLVKEVFALAKEKAPSIIFIDEIDALAAKRIEIGTSGEREVQRTFMQLLAELDGFKPLGDVKVIGATNRKDILDPAVIRPGRLDRLIEVPVPDKEGVKQIFKIHTTSMSLEKGIDNNVLIDQMDGFSGAEIKAVCTEAGYFAIRNKRKSVMMEDFVSAISKVKDIEESDGEEYLRMMG
ncbi:proteasome-activating nucleotidase [Candidatus Woesearchaeota archaeon]|nr:proteasome-activating nucleotidase [Candidatus Woesearchaeota archaeon]MBW3021804.1 proteasome-activating nucleotidase [Candidatus Woesearchaeota archaeon]